MGRNWIPKHECVCLKCGWQGVRGNWTKPCPKCGAQPVKKYPNQPKREDRV
jgi:predicted  nucleic acid-binding Zn-ribbon protein